MDKILAILNITRQQWDNQLSSNTVKFNGAMGTVGALLPILEMVMPQLEMVLPPNIYAILFGITTAGNWWLRFRTNKDLAER